MAIKHIALDVLKACPGALAQHLDKGVYFPGELSCEKLNYTKPEGVQLLVSAHNPGALEAASELADKFPWIRISIASESSADASVEDADVANTLADIVTEIGEEVVHAIN